MQTRQSNIELLRIVSMFMILCVHFTGATFNLPNIMKIQDLSSINTTCKVLMESFSIIGVNCFVLISGYFGIKPSIKGATNFILWCMFYAVSIYTLVAIIKPTADNISYIFSSFLIFSHTDLWFIPAYFALYIISPLINKGLQNMGRKEFSLLLIAFTFLNVYLGWFWQGNINQTGYNAMQLIYIYVIGRYIRIYSSANKKYRITYITTYITASALIFISTFTCKSTMAFAYNSPFVIGASVSFFLFFTTFSFQNKWINSIAANAFAVYLIHKMPPIWGTLKNLLYSTCSNMSYISFAIYWIVFIILIFAVCILIDKIRLYIMSPITNYISSTIQRFI